MIPNPKRPDLASRTGRSGRRDPVRAGHSAHSVDHVRLFGTFSQGTRRSRPVDSVDSQGPHSTEGV